MKWTFLRRRSSGIQFGIRTAPLSEACFEPTNLDGRCDDHAEETRIASKQLLEKMESMNVVDEEAQDTKSRDRTSPAFKNADDTAHQPFTSCSEPDAGVQPSCPLGPSAQFETRPPENSNDTILLQAANVLERVEAYIEQCTASLRYFVDLGSGNRSRDFADVKRNLTNTHTLVNASAPILLMVRELAVGFRALTTPLAGFTPTAQGELKRVNIVEVPMVDPSRNNQATPQVDRVPTQEQIDEQERVELGSTPNEPDDPKRAGMLIAETEVPPEEPSADNQPMVQVDRAPTQKQQDERKPIVPISTSNEQDDPKREGMLLAEIEVPLEEPSADSQPTLQVDRAPTQEQLDEQNLIVPGSTLNEQDDPKREGMLLAEIEVPLEEPSADSRPTLQIDRAPTQEQLDEQNLIVPCSTLNEQDEPKPVSMILSETEVPPDERGMNIQPTLQVDPVLTQEQQDERKPVDPASTSNERYEAKRLDKILSEIERPLDEPSMDSQPMLQVDCVPDQEHQDKQKRVDMVLSEIQNILTERPPTQKAGIEQENAALPVSENEGVDARLTIKGKSVIPLNAHHVERKQDELKMSDPVTQEIEALLGLSSSQTWRVFS